MGSKRDLLDKNNIPQHIAIIMDGNGRWAKQKFGRNRIFGHSKGVNSVRLTTEACREIGVKYLTLYTFSTENWTRPASEVNALMKLLVKTIKSETKSLKKNGVKLNTIGEIDRLPGDCCKYLEEAMEATKDNTELILTLALSYSSRRELTTAIRKIAEDVAKGTLSPENVNEKLIESYLATRNIPDPELLVRTSGEKRISNYLLWQIAYSELYFTDTLWPDFDKEELYKAVYEFQQRERRFGKISEQVIAE